MGIQEQINTLDAAIKAADVAQYASRFDEKSYNAIGLARETMTATRIKLVARAARLAAMGGTAR